MLKITLSLLLLGQIGTPTTPMPTTPEATEPGSADHGMYGDIYGPSAVQNAKLAADIAKSASDGWRDASEAAIANNSDVSAGIQVAYLVALNQTGHTQILQSVHDLQMEANGHIPMALRDASDGDFWNMVGGIHYVTGEACVFNLLRAISMYYDAENYYSMSIQPYSDSVTASATAMSKLHDAALLLGCIGVVTIEHGAEDTPLSDVINDAQSSGADMILHHNILYMTPEQPKE